MEEDIQEDESAKVEIKAESGAENGFSGSKFVRSESEQPQQSHRTGFLRSFSEKKPTYLHNKIEADLSAEDVSRKSCEASESSDKTEDLANEAPSLCKWHECSVHIRSASELSDHVHKSHVEPMVVQDVFVCLWEGCKVFNKPSCSHSWLSKHVNSHTGDKPFKCVISGCTMSFVSCEGLSRHVSAHFNEPKIPKRPRGLNKNSPKTRGKKKKVKVIQKRCRALPVKDDFMNTKSVQSIKKCLPKMMPESACHVGIDGAKIKVYSRVVGKRTSEESGFVEVLLHWLPDEILPDEWVAADDAEKNKSRSVFISSLPNDIVADLDPAFYRCLSRRKHPRK